MCGGYLPLPVLTLDTVDVCGFFTLISSHICHYRCLLDIYLDQRSLEEQGEEEKKEGEKKDGEKEKDCLPKEDADVGIRTPMTTKILSHISYLLSQPGIKSAILQLIGSG